MKNKVEKLSGPDGKEYAAFICPGCKMSHCLPVGGDVRPKWEFNGNLQSPTFAPSILSREYDGDKVVGVCHSFVRNGQIQFLGDCTHALKGQTVPLAEAYE